MWGGLRMLSKEEKNSWDYYPLGSGMNMVREVGQLARGQRG